MNNLSRRRQAAAIAVLAGVALVISLTVILAVVINSEKEDI